LKTFSMSNPLDCVIPARRESIRVAERTESAKTDVSAARAGRAVVGPGRTVGKPTDALRGRNAAPP
jgi:hypothetical protein